MKIKWLVVACVLGALVASVGAEEKKTELPFSLKPYGYVKLDASYDTQRTQAGDLMFYVLPEVAGEKDNEFNMTAKETRLGLALSGPDSGAWKTTGKIEGDFYGSGGSANAALPRLRLGYMDLANDNGFSVRAGQDWETFVVIVPRTVNFSYLADAGALGLRRPQVRLSQDLVLSEQTKLVARAAAARTIGEDLDGGGQDDGVDSGTPTFQYALYVEQATWVEKKTAKIGVSGHFGQETLDGSTSNKIVTVDDKNYNSWSVIGNISLPLCKRMTLQGTIWTGENLDTYYGGIGQGINVKKDTAIGAQGGFIQLLADVTESLSVTLNYSLDDPKDDDLNANQRAKNELIMANAYYKITSAVTVAAEYSHMTTSYLDADDAKNDRIQLAGIYKF